MAEPENLVLEILREMRKEMVTKSELAAVKSELKHDIADVGSEVKSLRADVASDLMTIEKRLGDRITYLQRSVMEFHSSTIGHGVLYSEMDERLRRVEQHLKLTPNDGH